MSTEWDDVALAVRRRRESLGLTQRSAATNAGVSLATWNVIENPGGNAKFRGLTLRAVARALRWPADAIERVLAGEDPADWDEPTSVAADPSLHPTGGLPADVSRPADVAIAALNDTAGQLTPEQREQLLALARTMLEQRRAAERGP